MANPNGFLAKIYATENAGVVTDVLTYPTIGIGSQSVGAVEPYVNTGKGIADGAKIILKASNINGGLPQAYISNSTVSAIVTLWNG
jgi:hypothetical protein